jgi:hypothetical protein
MRAIVLGIAATLATGLSLAPASALPVAPGNAVDAPGPRSRDALRAGRPSSNSSSHDDRARQDPREGGAPNPPDKETRHASHRPRDRRYSRHRPEPRAVRRARRQKQRRTLRTTTRPKGPRVRVTLTTQRGQPFFHDGQVFMAARPPAGRAGPPRRRAAGRP